MEKTRQRHVDPIYYTAKDVQEILQYSRSAAYNRIKELNEELKAKGYHVRPGLIPRKYFEARFGLA